MYKIKLIILTIFRIMKYLLGKKKRYSNLLLQIILNKPKTILEVGVYNGNRALEMIQAAKIFNKNIKYFGFDLFEDFSDDILINEHSKKPTGEKQIFEKLSKHSEVKLIKGNTIQTLPNFITENRLDIDFIFIDGGHSIKTIEEDCKNCLKIINNKSYIIFDDYYLNDHEIVQKYGSNKTFEQFDNSKYFKKLLPFTDVFKIDQKFQYIKMFKIKLK